MSSFFYVFLLRRTAQVFNHQDQGIRTRSRRHPLRSCGRGALVPLPLSQLRGAPLWICELACHLPGLDVLMDAQHRDHLPLSLMGGHNRVPHFSQVFLQDAHQPLPEVFW